MSDKVCQFYNLENRTVVHKSYPRKGALLCALPQKFVKALGIVPGEYLEVSLKEGGIFISPLKLQNEKIAPAGEIGEPTAEAQFVNDQHRCPACGGAGDNRAGDASA